MTKNHLQEKQGSKILKNDWIDFQKNKQYIGPIIDTYTKPIIIESQRLKENLISFIEPNDEQYIFQGIVVNDFANETLKKYSLKDGIISQINEKTPENQLYFSEKLKEKYIDEIVKELKEQNIPFLKYNLLEIKDNIEVGSSITWPTIFISKLTHSNHIKMATINAGRRIKIKKSSEEKINYCSDILLQNEINPFIMDKDIEFSADGKTIQQFANAFLKYNLRMKKNNL